ARRKIRIGRIEPGIQHRDSDAVAGGGHAATRIPDVRCGYTRRIRGRELAAVDGAMLDSSVRRHVADVRVASQLEHVLLWKLQHHALDEPELLVQLGAGGAGNVPGVALGPVFLDNDADLFVRLYLSAVLQGRMHRQARIELDRARRWFAGRASRWTGACQRGCAEQRGP